MKIRTKRATVRVPEELSAPGFFCGLKKAPGVGQEEKGKNLPVYRQGGAVLKKYSGNLKKSEDLKKGVSL